MSRSYKKTGAGSICSSHTDKSDRNIYHRAERRKAKILLNEEIKFGIGTYITCDTNVKHMNQVLKIVKVNGRDVAKLSDTPGKTMCLDSNYVEYLQRSIDWRLSH